MSQAEILLLLEQNKSKWFSHKTLMGRLRLSPSVVSVNLMKLRKWGSVEHKKETRKQGIVVRTRGLYKYKNVD